MRTALLIATLLFAFSQTGRGAEPRFRVEAPSVVLRGVPVPKVVVTAYRRGNEAGGEWQRDWTFDGSVPIEGLLLEVNGESVPLPRFVEGRLELQTAPAQRARLWITGDVVVDPGADEIRQVVTTIPGWLSLLPPFVAVLLAIWLRQVLPALLLGIVSGALVLSLGNPITATVLTLSEFVVEPMVDSSHVQIILFTTFLGCTVAVMYASGGTHALVGLLRPFLKTREGVQMGTAALGTIVFFDDYANTLLVGTTMRPVTDGQGISREKLAFLVDATAAPIAGLALISTWVGFELAQIQAGYEAAGLEADAYATFLATLPYRFYPILLLVFVGSIATSGRDYGAMHRAEDRAARRVGSAVRDSPATLTPGGASAATTPATGNGAAQLEVDHLATGVHRPSDSGGEPRVVNAAVPLAFLLAAIAFGLWWTGSRGAVAAGEAVTLRSVLSNSDSYSVLLYSSSLASVVAVLCAVGTRALSLERSVDAWTDGVRQMLPALMVLVLAWGLAAVCSGEHLNTAAYLVTSTSGWVSAAWMPTLAFLLAAGVSFATGSSWATMGLLIPLFVPYTHDLLASGTATIDPHDPLLLGTVGAVLAGSIFGDHCSPISDTTVLSSAAAGCDHLDHVATQLPYALTVGGICLVFCSVPTAFGVSPYVGLLVGGIAVVSTVLIAGRPISENAAEVRENPDA